ncbi:ATP-binding protein [Pseudoalteromonas sp. SG43-7]|uniref:ATP-binding protein n=1 Tax=Pseudoalteromonas sp. SG43-7 TaxID=2760966 RepID=UPI0016028091|nr:ATP-binding protein [Pseudoalteromonas sp. SG43-7]MBB1423730.1 ATP-binding protein [Pseudoalteromonas sp. SG43-7]
MSQSLPIPAQRWLSLLLCAITAAAITVFVSNVSFVQHAYMKWGSILYASPVLHYSFAFLAGIGIKLMLDKFYISHAKRSIGFSWKYPPATIAVWFSIIATLVYVFISERYQGYLLDDELLFASLKYLHIAIFACVLCISFQELQEKAKKVSIKSWGLLFLLLGMFLVMSGYYDMPWPLITTYILLYSIAVILRVRGNGSSEVVSTNNYIALSDSDNEFSDLEDFRAWFKDDSIITSTAQLERDLQVYANRITERLRNGGDEHEEDIAQHIALCGPFGCGKSSIVAAIANELKKSKKVEAELSDEEKLKVERQNKINWIHSDIPIWGAASGSVAHVILSHIIDDISPHLDMCAFRALPKHYTEALKSGGSLFQFASTLLAGPVDIEESFKKLNDVLEATNHKLLITLQDVDRGTEDENEKRQNDIAALLDRLKDRDLSNINFIVAMGNENDIAAEVISKATDYREDIALSDSVEKILNKFILSTIHKAKETGVLVLNDDLDVFDEQGNRLPLLMSKTEEVELILRYLNTFRALKKVLRRADEALAPDRSDGLMGEINIFSLLMLYTLREKEVKAFNRVLHFLNEPNYIRVQGQDLKGSLEEIAQNDKNIHHFIVVLLNLIEIDDKYHFDRLKDYLQGIHSPKYLHRALKQNVDKIDSDQNFIETLKDITQSKDLLSFVKYWLETNSFASEDRVAQFIFCDLESGKLDSSLFFDYKTVVGHTNDEPTRRVAFYIASRLTIESIVDIELFLSNSSEDTTCIKRAKHRLRVALIEVLTDSYERRFSEIFSKTFEEQLPKGLYALTRAAYDSLKCNTGINADIALLVSNYKNADILEKQIKALTKKLK